MEWSKKLSKSDAQQETRGGLMPFRFTQENCPGDQTTWFREVLFNDADWKDKTWGKYQLEEADIKMSVSIQGEDLGQRDMILTHAERRSKNHNAPATHLNFDEVTKEYLQDNDMTGKEITISKDALTGGFELVIQDSEP